MSAQSQKKVDSDDLASLLARAVGVKEKAYAPYSNFAVGAAILDERGAIHLGVNIENAAYPLGSCAEASAIAAMVLAGGQQIRAIAVAGSGTLPCSPCGGCRQRIREFATQDTVVAIAAGDVLVKTMLLSELLPDSFGPENLG